MNTNQLQYENSNTKNLINEITEILKDNPKKLEDFYKIVIALTK